MPPSKPSNGPQPTRSTAPTQSTPRAPKPFEGRYICPECEQRVFGQVCDSGIGPYEFWGQKGFDSRPYWGCENCDAELCDDHLA